MGGLVLRRGLLMVLALTMAISLAPAAYADEPARYELGHAVQAGLDDGYAAQDAIAEKDPHFGWELGQFSVTGYVDAITDEADAPVFIKGADEAVWLEFDLLQDIDCLNGNERLSIAQDTNGYDEKLGVAETDFGHGALVIQRTDSQGVAGEPMVYTDFLAADAEVSAATGVALYEEGDYEVALDYELVNDPRRIFGQSLFPAYYNYRIAFGFSVRNAGTSVQLCDAATDRALGAASSAENGFYIDFDKSPYFVVDVRRDVVSDDRNDLVEDARFDDVDRDAGAFVDEGVYTLSVANPYTGEQSERCIYVGTDEVLRAFVATGIPLAEIRVHLADGAQVEQDGTLVKEGEVVQASGDRDWPDVFGDWRVWLAAGLIVVAVLVILLVRHSRRKRSNKKRK